MDEILLREDCPFCAGIHTSRYADELEELVMACREQCAPEQRGTLEAWGDRDTMPVSVEAVAYAAARYDYSEDEAHA